MVRLLELRIPDIGLAMLAPIFWLSKESAGVRQKVWVGNLPSISSILTSCPPSRIPYVRLTGVAIQPFRVFDTKLKCLRISQKAALYVNIGRGTKEWHVSKGRRNQPPRLAWKNLGSLECT